MKQDEKWMRLAIELAERGTGWVNPNPLVGAVIVKDGVLIGQGWHEKYGELHAERNAIANCKQRYEKIQSDWKGLLQDSCIYVTLEPCCHYGKTPPCTEAILEHGIKKVVIGAVDPNPLVGGKGIEWLKQQGIAVQTGVLEEECMQQNQVFFHYMKAQMPYVVMKYAMTADGKIATHSGDSKWITGYIARNHVHETRKKLMAIMVGVNTVLTDDPLLNCRLEKDPKNPIRIICDSQLRIPLESQIVATAKEISTIVACVSREVWPVDHLDGSQWEQQNADKLKKRKALERKGITIIEISPNENGKVDLVQLMKELGKRNIDSILLEGGGTLNFTALQSGIVSKVQAYLAPKLFGGVNAKTPVEGEGISLASEGIPMKLKKMQMLGEDLLLEYQIGHD